MEIVAIQNQKGGTGKSTTAINLAGALAEHGKKILVLDLDQQRSTSNCLDAPKDDDGAFAVLCLGEDITEHIFETNIPEVAILPSSLKLVGAETAIASNPALSMSPTTILRRALTKVSGIFDYVLIDTPPALGPMTKNALVAATSVLIPVETQYMALEGLAGLLETYKAVTAEMNPSLRILGILGTRHQAKPFNNEVLQNLRDTFGELVFDVAIRENTHLAEAPSHQLTVMKYKKDAAGTEDYRKLASEFLTRTGAPMKRVANG